MAVFIRRRFPTTGLLIVGVFAAAGLAVSFTHMEPFVSEFAEASRLPIAGSVFGVVASATALDRFIRRNPEPDVLPEIALTTAVFLVGVVVGIALAAMTLLRIA